MADTPKSKRVILDVKQKLEIIKYHECNPKRSQQEISNYFTELWKIDVKRRTVGDIIHTSGKKRTRDSELEVSSSPRKRIRMAHHENMEDALYMWFTNARAKNVPVTDDILKLKAKKFGDDLGVNDFKYSNGWLNRFKTRHGISCHVISGESAGINPDLIFDGRVKAREAMSNYDLKDIFNVDETGLFYRILPDRSLTTADATKGVKKSKDRITVALVCNADGSEKIKPFVIGKCLNPRCFKNFNYNLYVDYTANKKAWMTSIIFRDFLMKFDRKKRVKNRHVLLIMDNAPSHAVPKLTNVKIHFLPPTTTSHLQPLDAGIIQAFKAHYRSFDKNILPKVLLSEAIRFIKLAWESVTPDTIKNCWIHSGLVSDDNTAQAINSTSMDDQDLVLSLSKVQDSLDLDPEMRLTVREFLNLDNNVESLESLTDDEISSAVTINKTSENAEGLNDDSGDEAPAVPTYTDARQGLECLMRYLESKESTTESEMNFLLQMSDKIKPSKQSTIDMFFKRQ